jgi:hypothetical protein
MDLSGLDMAYVGQVLCTILKTVMEGESRGVRLEDSVILPALHEAWNHVETNAVYLYLTLFN